MEGSIYATKSGEDDHVAAIRKLQRALMTTLFDAAGKGSARLVGRSCAGVERTGLSPQAPPQNLRRFSGLRFADRKNRTSIGPHLGQPRAAERLVISVVEISYVRVILLPLCQFEMWRRSGAGHPSD